jgi:hypothetical protein
MSRVRTAKPMSNECARSAYSCEAQMVFLDVSRRKWRKHIAGLTSIFQIHNIGTKLASDRRCHDDERRETKNGADEAC